MSGNIDELVVDDKNGIKVDWSSIKAFTSRGRWSTYAKTPHDLLKRGILNDECKGNFSLFADGVVPVNLSLGERILYFTDRGQAESYVNGFLSDAQYKVVISRCWCPKPL